MISEINTPGLFDSKIENLCIKHRFITVIGSGGKTALIWRLAAGFKLTVDNGRETFISGAENRKILVTPTTKMFVPQKKEKLYDRYCDGVPPCPIPGITLSGIFNKASGKLEALPEGCLEEIIPSYDLVLMEGDGSRGLPLKAWTADEPVVPPFTNLTIGVLPLWPLGEPVSEKIIHRLPLFLALSGAAEGEALTMEHFRKLITGSAAGSMAGLFAKARGEKILFFNQIEDDSAMEQARELAESLAPEFRKGLCGIYAGSVRENRFTEL